MRCGTESFTKEQHYEFLLGRKKKKKTPWLLGSHTNVWAIGAVMYELMTLMRVFPAIIRSLGQSRQGIEEIRRNHHPEYSHALRDCIRRCLRPKPSHRPFAATLLEEVKGYRDTIRRETGEKPKVGDNVFYIGHEFKQMVPGSWQASQGAKEKKPHEPEQGFHDPELSSVVFPFFADANYLSSDLPARSALDRRKREEADAIRAWTSEPTGDEGNDSGPEEVGRLSEEGRSGRREIPPGSNDESDNNIRRAKIRSSAGDEASEGSPVEEEKAEEREEVEMETEKEEEVVIEGTLGGLGTMEEEQEEDTNELGGDGSLAEGEAEASEDIGGIEDRDDEDYEDEGETEDNDEDEYDDSETSENVPRRRRGATPFEDQTYDDGSGDVEDDDEPSVTVGRRRMRGAL